MMRIKLASKKICLEGASPMRWAKSSCTILSHAKGTDAPSSTSPRSCVCTCSPKLRGRGRRGGPDECLCSARTASIVAHDRSCERIHFYFT